MRTVVGLIAVLAPLVGASAGCEECCSPGGSCDHAFKQSPGICCGVEESTSMCCPTTANCFRCVSGMYRCYAQHAEPSCAICGAAGDPRPQCSASHGGGGGGSGGMLLGGFALVLLCCFCCSRMRGPDPSDYYPAAVPAPGAYNQQAAPYYQQAGPYPTGGIPEGLPVAPEGQPPGYGAPGYYGAPPPAAPPGYGYPGGGYPQQPYEVHQEGYSGGAVAASAGAGFIGGILADRAAQAVFGGGGGGGGSGAVPATATYADAGFAADTGGGDGEAGEFIEADGGDEFDAE